MKLEKKCNFKSFRTPIIYLQTNFLTYHGVITAIRFYIKKPNIPINDLEKINGPLIPDSSNPA
jgi:hypothetical protein